jgi:hypothetical protein
MGRKSIRNMKHESMCATLDICQIKGYDMRNAPIETRGHGMDRRTNE